MTENQSFYGEQVKKILKEFPAPKEQNFGGASDFCKPKKGLGILEKQYVPYSGLNYAAWEKFLPCGGGNKK